MPRMFDGVNDDFVTGTGALSGMTYGTVAVLYRLTSLSPWHGLFEVHDSGGTFLGAVVMNDSFKLSWYSGAGNANSGVALSAGVWYLQVVRKATGSAVPRFSHYNFTTQAWSHAAGTDSVANWTAPGASGTVKCTSEGAADFVDGDLAVRAAWANALPWAASGAGDALLEAAGLHFSLMAWMGAAPSALWVFDQSDTTQKVSDLTGGGANETSLIGTTVTADSVPTFGYGADLFELRTAPTTGLPPEIEGPENSSTMYTRGFGKG